MNVGDIITDYNGNKYKVIIAGNEPNTPFIPNNVVNNDIVWGDIHLRKYGGDDINYSEDEVECGTWTNGKTLYRKAFLVTTPNTAWQSVADITSLNIADVIEIYGTVEATSGKYLPVPIYHSNTEFVSAYVTTNNTSLSMTASDNLKSKNCKLIMIYTKN